jgi:hypothetical protein
MFSTLVKLLGCRRTNLTHWPHGYIGWRVWETLFSVVAQTYMFKTAVGVLFIYEMHINTVTGGAAKE